MSDPAAVAAGAAAEAFTIKETITKTYLGTTKTVNHYNERVNNATTGDYVDRDAYYDKETGVLLEMTITHYYANYQETDSENWKINQFNSVSASPDGTDGTTNGNSNGAFPDWFVPVVAAVVIVIIAMLITVIVLNRRKRPQLEEPATEPVQPSPQPPV
jgi:hypothetical protein